MMKEKRLAAVLGIDLRFVCHNSATVHFGGPVDLLFIDSLHVYGHLKRELDFHHRNVNHYIIMHDTTTTTDAWESEVVRESDYSPN